ncbi:hypothetical protein HMPREF2892_08190 [Aerococcus sp. HMSC061A03]|nr:hypothetical protein HMPREF2892_08190 [Aerococcus sp. HMSC061A03]
MSILFMIIRFMGMVFYYLFIMNCEKLLAIILGIVITAGVFPYYSINIKEPIAVGVVIGIIIAFVLTIVTYLVWTNFPNIGRVLTYLYSLSGAVMLFFVSNTLFTGSTRFHGIFFDAFDNKITNGIINVFSLIVISLVIYSKRSEHLEEELLRRKLSEIEQVE